MNELSLYETKQDLTQHIALVGESEEKTARTSAILKNFFSLLDKKHSIRKYSNIEDLLKAKIPERILVVSNETAFEQQEDLHYLKMLKRKFNTATIVHAYKRFSPTHMDDMIVKATTKFVKEDALYERNLERSLSVLFNSKKRNYGS